MKVRLGRELRKNRGKGKYEHHTPITRPTGSEVSVFEKHLERISSGKGEPKILILGPSPELRDLAARNNLITTVVANDLEVIERASGLMKEKNEKERWLEGEITGLPFGKSSFDAVFGDHIVSDSPPFNQEKFYRRMREVLKKKGFAVMRSVVFRKTEKPFEKKVSRHFKIVEKEFGKEGIFSENFPIYFIRPK